ncbi:alpha/beta hydrolase [bacterium]|nr:alpha/beta hydrolase [bacterium]
MPTAGGLYYFTSQQNGDRETPAVVLIHGAGGTHMHWPYNLRRLNNHRVFAPDLPGHGKSSGLGKQSVDKYAETIAEWMEAVGIDRALIIGHSMGGAIAQSLAINFPHKVTGLILIGTGAKLTVSQELLDKLSIPSSTPAAIDQVIQWSWNPNTDKKLLKQVREQMMKIRSAVIYGDFLACNNFDLTRKIDQIEVPTLVIVGENDKMTPLHINKQLESKIPTAKMAVISDCGHMVMLENPEAVADEVFGFIQTFPV